MLHNKFVVSEKPLYDSEHRKIPRLWCQNKINFTLFDGRVGALRVHRPLGLSYYWVTILQLHEYTKMKFKNLMAAATIHSLSICGS